MGFPDFHQLQIQQAQHEDSVQVISGGQKRADRLQYFTLQLWKLPLNLEEQAIELAMFKSGYALAVRPIDRVLARNGLNWLLRGANEMNIDLAVQIKAPAYVGHSDLVKGVVIGLGKMAKACEALDHVERFPSREILEENTIALTQLLVNYSATAGIDLPAAMQRHWAQEAKQFPTRPRPAAFLPKPANEPT